MTNLYNKLLTQFLSNQSEFLVRYCRHIENAHLPFLERKKKHLKKITDFSNLEKYWVMINAGFIWVWFMQDDKFV